MGGSRTSSIGDPFKGKERKERKRERHWATLWNPHLSHPACSSLCYCLGRHTYHYGPDPELERVAGSTCVQISVLCSAVNTVN